MKIKNTLKKYALSLALLFMLGFTGALVSCGGQGSTEVDESTETEEATEMEAEEEAGEHPEGEHPEGDSEHPEGEHPAEDESDSTSME